MCQCESDIGYHSYELTGLLGLDACLFTAELCQEGVNAEFTEPPECRDTSQERGPSWCSTERECTRSAQVAEGVSVIQTDWQYAYCDLIDNAWTCQCDVPGSSISFDLPTPADAASVCPQAMDICTVGEFEVSGPRECSPTYQSASPDWCDAELDCTRAARIGETEVNAHEWMYTNCEGLGDGEWRCDCSVGPDSSSFSLTSDDPWQACQVAASACLETVGDSD